MMFITLLFSPKNTHKFSTRKVLPPKNNKISLDKQSTLPFRVIKDTNFAEIDEINIISSSSTFNLNLIKEMKAPIFLNAFWNNLKVDKEGNILYLPNPNLISGASTYSKVNARDSLFKKHQELEDYVNPNITYIHNVTTALDYLQSKGNNVLAIIHYLEKDSGEIYKTSTDYYKSYFKKYGITDSSSYYNFLDSRKIKQIHVLEKIYKPMKYPYTDAAPTGSLLTNLMTLSTYSKKINVYGWDFYLKKPAKEMNSIELLFNAWNPKLDINRSKMLFEISLMNIYFASKLSQSSKFKVHGFLSKLEKHEKLIKQIEKVFFLPPKK